MCATNLDRSWTVTDGHLANTIIKIRSQKHELYTILFSDFF